MEANGRPIGLGFLLLVAMALLPGLARGNPQELPAVDEPAARAEQAAPADDVDTRSAAEGEVEEPTSRSPKAGPKRTRILRPAKSQLQTDKAEPAEPKRSRQPARGKKRLRGRVGAPAVVSPGVEAGRPTSGVTVILPVLPGCGRDEDCATRRCNNPTQDRGVCMEPVALEAPCDQDENCASGRCLQGLCVPQIGQGTGGSFCTQSPQCSDMACIDGTCVDDGSVPNGGTCASHRQCQSGICDTGPVVPNCEPANGTALRGEWCLLTRHCEGSLVCNTGLEPNECTDAFKDLGESCWEGQGQLDAILYDLAPSKGKSECKSKRCDIRSHTCVPNEGEGQAGDYCTATGQCRAGLSCVDEQCFSGSDEAIGEACGGNADCRSGVCDAAAQRCIPGDGTGGEMDYCTDDVQCGGSMYCDGDSCSQPNIPLGQSCVGHSKDPCASGYCNNDGSITTFDSGKCIPDPGTGEVGDFCVANGDCATNRCTGGECVAIGSAELGAQCSADQQCIHGRCDPAPMPGQPRRCIPNDATGQLGDHCSRHNHCLPGLRCIPPTPGAVLTCAR